eukprot:scaffold2737_cov229-Pinguiococcus_pyrenoidosus.AAC.7
MRTRGALRKRPLGALRFRQSAEAVDFRMPLEDILSRWRGISILAAVEICSSLSFALLQQMRRSPQRNILSLAAKSGQRPPQVAASRASGIPTFRFAFEQRKAYTPFALLHVRWSIRKVEPEASCTSTFAHRRFTRSKKLVISPGGAPSSFVRRARAASKSSRLLEKNPSGSQSREMPQRQSLCGANRAISSRSASK